MHLLIITQRVDRTDPILGFFHGWMTELAKHCDTITVIGQQVGEYELPKNVTVLSLGKEAGTPRWRQICRFWFLIMRQRSQYDRVLVHMTPIWVALGWPVWALLPRSVYLWYEHARGRGWALSVALHVCKKIFGATERGLSRISPRRVILGHGIDIDAFRPGESREGNTIVAVGRITPVKRYDLILRTFAALPASFQLCIAGGAFTDQDDSELHRIRALIEELNIGPRVHMDWVAPADMPVFLGHGTLMLHAAIGGLDKCILEAMACGCPVVTTNEASKAALPAICLATDTTMTDHARAILALAPVEYRSLTDDLRQRVVNGHSLQHLAERLVAEMR